MAFSRDYIYLWLLSKAMVLVGTKEACFPGQSGRRQIGRPFDVGLYRERVQERSWTKHFLDTCAPVIYHARSRCSQIESNLIEFSDKQDQQVATMKMLTKITFLLALLGVVTLCACAAPANATTGHANLAPYPVPGAVLQYSGTFMSTPLNLSIQYFAWNATCMRSTFTFQRERRRRSRRDT